jgi:hypothetical protein
VDLVVAAGGGVSWLGSGGHSVSVKAVSGKRELESDGIKVNFARLRDFVGARSSLVSRD